MSDHFGTMLKRRNNARSNLRDLFSSAQHFSLTHAAMLERRAAIYDRCKIKTSPHWVASYLEGYWDAMTQHAYRHELIFGGIVDGKFYSTHSDRDDYYGKNGIEPRDYADDGRVKERGHYWAHSLKPFFISHA